LEYWGLLTAGAAVRLLPFRALKHLADLIGAIVFLADDRGRRVAEANLGAAFESMSTAERRRTARKSYQTFARTVIELFWMPNFTPEKLRKHVRIEGLEHYKPGEPTIYVCLHASNFEMLSLSQAPAIGSGIVVTQNFRNPLLGRIFDRLRASTGHTIIPQERAMIRMLRHLKAGGYFNAVIDFNLDPREASVIIDQFGGLKACVTQIHAALAMHTKARIIPAECHAEPNGTYRIVHNTPIVITPDETPEQIAQRCWNVLEPYIRENPQYWLWSYKHWRFRPSDEAGKRYPFYANTAKRFDKKLQAYRETAPSAA
jgi:lauroyl/myristoyl acyltransferase